MHPKNIWKLMRLLKKIAKKSEISSELIVLHQLIDVLENCQNKIIDELKSVEFINKTNCEISR